MPAPTRGAKPCGAFPRLQHRALELHDSKVLSVVADGAAVRILLDAYVHVSTGKPGRDAGTGWSQEVALVVAFGTVHEPHDGALWILDGEATLDGVPAGLLPLPLAVEGAVGLTLAGAEGRLRVSGRGLTVVEQGEPVFVEKVPATD